MKADDLEVGMFVAVSGFIGEDDSPEPSPWTYTRPRSDLIDGTPLEILAVSLPFVLLHNGHGQGTLDIRTVTLVRLQDEYVAAFRKTPIEKCRRVPGQQPPREPTTPVSVDCCGRCGSKQNLFRSATGPWAWKCRECKAIEEQEERVKRLYRK